LPICNIPISHREERSHFDKLKAPSLSRGDVAIHAPDDWIATPGSRARNDKQGVR
jgi:hypothetical protein